MNLPKLQTVIKDFGIIGAILAMATSAYGIILPLVIRSISQSDQTVGYYYTALAILGFAVSIFSTYLFSNFNKVKVFRINILVSLIGLFSMTLLQENISFYIVDLVRALCMSISAMSLTLMMKEIVRTHDVKTILRKYSQYAGIGMMAGAFAGGYMAKYFGNSSIFILAGILISIVLVVFYKIPIKETLENIEEKQLKKIKKKESVFSVFKYFKEYMKDVNQKRLYLLSLSRGIFASIFDVYFPIMIIRLQYNQDVIGNIKVGLAIVGILLGSSIIKLSNKYKYKNLLFLGYMLIAVCMFAYSIFATFETVWILFAFLLFYRIPRTLTSELRHQYFFSIVSNEEANKFYGLYDTGFKLGAVLGPLLASLLLSISVFVFDDSSLNLMWVGLTILMGWTSFVALKLKEPKI
ncbi:MAG: MFS transporter [Alphaproteobacteria bacterium]